MTRLSLRTSCLFGFLSLSSHGLLSATSVTLHVTGKFTRLDFPRNAEPCSLPASVQPSSTFHYTVNYNTATPPSYSFPDRNGWVAVTTLQAGREDIGTSTSSVWVQQSSEFIGLWSTTIGSVPGFGGILPSLNLSAPGIGTSALTLPLRFPSVDSYTFKAFTVRLDACGITWEDNGSGGKRGQYAILFGQIDKVWSESCEGPPQFVQLTSAETCSPTGPNVLLTPTWGEFGTRESLQSGAGDKLELWCETLPPATERQFVLTYSSADTTIVRQPIGLCTWHGGCNSMYISFVGRELDSRTGMTNPSCFLNTTWISRDYGPNDIPNPVTRENSESPPALDWLVWNFNATTFDLHKTNFKFEYRYGPPVPICGPVAGGAPREGPVVSVRQLDPPLGPETYGFFTDILLALPNVPPDPSVVSSRLLADLNGDGRLDIVDFVVFQNAVGACIRQNRFNPDADLDADGCITLKDYQIWLGLYNAKK